MMSTFFFGERWDAPIVDEAVQVDTPVGQRCYACGEAIEAGDRGFVRVVVKHSSHDEAAGTIEPVHAECDLIGVIGHMVGVCHCTGYDTASRAAARLAWERTGQARGSDLDSRVTATNPPPKGGGC